MAALPSQLPVWGERPALLVVDETSTRKIEDYRPGYPRLTALISAHSPYFLCRRFDRLRARLLLLKQDKLSMLEERLEQVDREEISPLFLGKSRCDRNTERISLTSEIESSLADYDEFAERTNRMLSFNPAQPRDIESLRNWLGGTGCLAREESAYLAHDYELVSLAPLGDSALVKLEAWVEDRFIRIWRDTRKSPFRGVSNDPNVYIYSGTWIRRIAKALLLLLIALLLMVPIIICNIISTVLTRIVIVMVSTMSYLIVLSLLTRSSTMELILAGATYATVLIVFVSGTSQI